MCEFCIQHGEGKKWYENMTNYTEDVFRQVNSKEHLKEYLRGFYKSIKEDTAIAYKWKRRFPRIYRFIAYPLVTRHLKQTHFGQIIPAEDIDHILEHFSSVIRLPCICRKVTIGEGKRYCLAIGMDLTDIFSDLPDFRDFERLTMDEAREFVKYLDGEGQTHSVWTFNTPFIAAICNCDRDCMAYRFQQKMDIGKIMWKGEYIAQVDYSRCSGCRECIRRCYFSAVRYDRKNGKCFIDPLKCYGCGICRAVCKEKAIDLLDRVKIPEAANSW
jgi:ferredoxin